MDENAQIRAQYSYDPWGAVTVLTANGSAHNSSTSIGMINPPRYRGYYYDTETSFYYLQTRYYDPALGRFLNADSYASTGQGFIGWNMFAYCGGDPINNQDFHGTSFKHGILGMAGHFVLDMLPWYLWGNSLDDTTTIEERILMRNL